MKGSRGGAPGGLPAGLRGPGAEWEGPVAWRAPRPLRRKRGSGQTSVSNREEPPRGGKDRQAVWRRQGTIDPRPDPGSLDCMPDPGSLVCRVPDSHVRPRPVGEDPNAKPLRRRRA